VPRRNGIGIALLADPTRLRIVQLLADHPRRPSTIAREVGLSRPAVSRQLRILHEAALIVDLPAPHDGRVRLLGLHPDNESRVRRFVSATELGLLPPRPGPRRRWAADLDPWDG
jgi:DNA-binding transcriptional ArsR family regulator